MALLPPVLSYTFWPFTRRLPRGVETVFTAWLRPHPLNLFSPFPQDARAGSFPSVLWPVVSSYRDGTFFDDGLFSDQLFGLPVSTDLIFSPPGLSSKNSCPPPGRSGGDLISSGPFLKFLETCLFSLVPGFLVPFSSCFLRPSISLTIVRAGFRLTFGHSVALPLDTHRTLSNPPLFFLCLDVAESEIFLRTCSNPIHPPKETSFSPDYIADAEITLGPDLPKVPDDACLPLVLFVSSGSPLTRLDEDDIFVCRF